MTTPPHLNPPTPESPEPGSGMSGPGSLPGSPASGEVSGLSGSVPAAGRGSGSAAGQVDVRGPRFGAVITSVLLAVVVVASLVAPTAALVGLALMAGLFAWGAFAGIRRHPWGRIFQRFVRPRLGPPTGFEDAAAPTFAQGVGLAVTGIGVRSEERRVGKEC